MREEDELGEYLKRVGHPPRNLPDDHPDAWQWKYTGSKKEREAMMRRMGFELEPDPEEPPPSQEETLW